MYYLQSGVHFHLRLINIGQPAAQLSKLSLRESKFRLLGLKRSAHIHNLLAELGRRRDYLRR